MQKKTARCRNGHRFTRESTLIRQHSENGRIYRTCRICERARYRKRYHRLRESPDPTRSGVAPGCCPKGHPWTRATTRWTVEGKRLCRRCRAALEARYRARRAMRVPPALSPTEIWERFKPRRTRCARRHPLTLESVGFKATGQWYCKRCKSRLRLHYQEERTELEGLARAERLAQAGIQLPASEGRAARRVRESAATLTSIHQEASFAPD